MEDMEDQSGTVVIQGHSEKVGAGLVVVAAMDLAWNVWETTEEEYCLSNQGKC